MQVCVRYYRHVLRSTTNYQLKNDLSINDKVHPMKQKEMSPRGHMNNKHNNPMPDRLVHRYAWCQYMVPGPLSAPNQRNRPPHEERLQRQRRGEATARLVLSRKLFKNTKNIRPPCPPKPCMPPYDKFKPTKEVHIQTIYTR